ncbi:MAG: pyridoxamine 5'-phosphate oxidase family protein [Oscillospiraceae bacterium]|nr:pyridoxamine 5'-phosphate oxidase family protein [Oscillospiraceae bacterium]
MNEKAITRASEIINAKKDYIGGGTDFVVLSLIDDEGFPTSAPITLSKADGIKWLSFLGAIDSNKVKRIKNCNKACVNISTSDYNITLVGTIEVVTDLETKKQHWQDVFTEHHGAVDCPDHCAFVFTTKRYSIFFMDDFTEAEGIL